VPTGFITAQTGIDKKIRKAIVDEGMLSGVISMPSNIFANTGTNVSIVFLDKENNGDVVLIDASNLGTTIKEGKNQKTLLSEDEENEIIRAFNEKVSIEDLSEVVSLEAIAKKNYSFSAGQYFDVKIEYVDITHDEYKSQINSAEGVLKELFHESIELDKAILTEIKRLSYE